MDKLLDKIYLELEQSLGKEPDYSRILAKYQKNKSSFYAALSKFFMDKREELETLLAREKEVKAAVSEQDTNLEQLNKQMRSIEEKYSGRVAELSKTEVDLAELRRTLEENSELLNELKEVQTLGFNVKKLRVLRDTIAEAGTKHELGPDEVLDKYFKDLSKYDAILDSHTKLKGLKTQIQTAKLEARNQKARLENQKREYRDLSETIEVLKHLKEKGITPDQVITWHRLLSKFAGPEEFEEQLNRYVGMEDLLSEKRKECEEHEQHLESLEGQMQVLNTEKARIEGAIKAALQCLEEYKAVAATVEKVRKLATTEIEFLSEKARKQIDDITSRAVEVGIKVGEIRKELQEWERIRDTLACHLGEAEKK
jgi:chromosome segregation ATPase